MNKYKPTEYIVDFGDYRSNRFVELSMALIEDNGAKLNERIVRCRDCAYFIDGKSCDNAYLFNVEPDGFCAWGEKR